MLLGAYGLLFMLKKKEEVKSLKIGVLLPQSKEYPLISREFLDGLKLYFTIHANSFAQGEAELVVEDVGFGTERVTNEKVRKLVAVDGVSLIVGLLEFNTAFQVGLVSDMLGVPCLFAGLGESAVPQTDHAETSFFFSLQYWKSYYALGRYVKKHQPEKPVHIVTSFYDCGYDPLRALRVGLGSELIARETVLKSYTSEELVEEIAKQVQFHEGERLALLLHPKLMNQFLISYGTHAKDAITGPIFEGNDQQLKYWSASTLMRNSEAYQQFEKGVNSYLETSATMHHILGYSTGNIVYEALTQLNSDGTNNHEIIKEVLGNYKSESILGPVEVNKESHEIDSAIEIRRGFRPESDYDVLETVTISQSDLQTLDSIFLVKNSFTNPYLFL